MRSLLITGSNGLLGGKLVLAASRAYKVFGLDVHPESLIRHDRLEYSQGDITDRDRVLRQLEAVEPDAVIHTAAYTDVDGCELHFEKAYAVNVTGAEHVAAACKRLGIGMVHLSTDYVFDGMDGPYREEDPPKPLSAYGRMKLDSERLVLSLLPDAVVVRTMVLFGHLPHVRRNFVTWLKYKLENGERIRVVNDQYGTPTFADDLAKALLAVFEKGLRGLYHAAGSEWLDRHAFALQVADVFGLDGSLISETTSDQFKQPAPRPMKSGLKTDKLERDTGFRFKPLVDALLELKSQMATAART